MIIALWIVGILAALCGIAAAWFGFSTPSGDGMGQAILSSICAVTALTLTIIWFGLVMIHLMP